MCRALLGRCFHWGPVAAFVIIKWITLSGVYCNTMWWPPESGWGGLANMMGFLSLACLTMYHYMAAMCDGPGFVPLGWRPKNPKDEAKLQFCQACKGFKAPRAHHCRKCGRCVMKMDHHCPWINTCVGHANHGHFIGFLFFAVVGCIQASFILAMSLYYGLNRSWYHYYGTGREPKVTLNLVTLIVVLFGLGLAIGVVLAVGALLFFQMRSVIRNQTGIEDWIMEKAAYRLRGTGDTFLNPYDLGWKKNFHEVIRPGCYSVGNGMDWKLRDGADEYDMTMEQLMQKEDKRHRTREYKIITSYSGSWLPFWSMGCRVALHPPCTDEPRIHLSKGDHIMVTRWKKYWLYGDKVLTSKHSGDSAGPDRRIRGWFPRRCAVDFMDVSSSTDMMDSRTTVSNESTESSAARSRHNRPSIVNGREETGDNPESSNARRRDNKKRR